MNGATRRDVARFLAHTVLTDLIIFALIGTVGLLAGWQIEQYGGALVWTGLAVLMAGMFSSAGSWFAGRSFGFQYAQSLSEKSLLERAQEELQDNAQSLGFLYRMAAISVAPLLIGLRLLFLV